MNAFSMIALSALLASTPSLAMNDAELAEIVGKRLHGDRTGACFAAALVQGSETARAFVCADAEAEPRIGPQHAFEIGSISKTMVAALLAEQIQSGELSLDDRLDAHLTGAEKVPDFAGEPIRLRHLVTHTSGLPALPATMQSASPLNPYAALSEADLLTALAQTPLSAAPGSTFAYSNFASMVLSLMITQKAEAPLESLLQNRLFQPLGMDGAYLQQPPEGIEPAQGHTPNGNATPAWTFAENLAGVGGVRATLNDMVRYARGQLGQFDLPLNAALELSQQRVETGQRAMAMNWMLAPLDDRQIHVHEGGTGGFSSFMAFDLERDRAVIVLSDTALTSLGGLGSLGQHLLDERLPLAEPRRQAQPDDALLDALVGRYELAGGLAMELRREGQTLFVQATGQPAFEMGYDSKGDFFPLAFDALLTPQQMGGVWSFVWSQGGGAVPARRADTPAAEAVPEALLQGYVGEYALTPQFVITFRAREGVLYAQATGQGEFALEPTQRDRFAAPQYGIEIAFERDDEGAVNAMTLYQRGAEQRALKR